MNGSTGQSSSEEMNSAFMEEHYKRPVGSMRKTPLLQPSENEETRLAGRRISRAEPVPVPDTVKRSITLQAGFSKMSIQSDVGAAAMQLNSWMLSDGSQCDSVMDFLRQYSLKISEHVPCDRVFVGSYLIHAQADAWIWKSELGRFTEITVSKEEFAKRFDLFGKDAPFIQLQLGAPMVRVRVTDDSIPDDCQGLFKNKGFTDLYGRPHYRRGQFSKGYTWGTTRPEGFSTDHLNFFDATLPVLSNVIELLVTELMTRSLLCTYLGRHPGTRVSDGLFDKGDVITMQTALWYCDFRDFATMCNMMDRSCLLDLMNEIYETMEKVLKAYGGEILKFMAGGLTAVFHGTGSNPNGGQICHKARMAAEKFQEKMKEIRKKRAQDELPGSSVDVGVSLNWGQISYSCIGGVSRLDFAVMGSAMNVVSGVEKLGSEIDVNVLATEEFVRLDTDGNWKSMGPHSVPGLTDTIPVFALDASAPRRLKPYYSSRMF